MSHKLCPCMVMENIKKFCNITHQIMHKLFSEHLLHITSRCSFLRLSKATNFLFVPEIGKACSCLQASVWMCYLPRLVPTCHFHFTLTTASPKPGTLLFSSIIVPLTVFGFHLKSFVVSGHLVISVSATGWN